MNGKERIIELYQYKLRFVNEESGIKKEEVKREAGPDPGPEKKALKLVGKRIKQLVSDDSSEDESNTVKNIKIKLSQPMKKVELPPQEKSQPSISSASGSSQPPKPISAIAKLPRM